MMPSKYCFADYSDQWPAAFDQEKANLLALLGDELVAVHHIGSTSIPGLAAKPIIDLLPLVRRIEFLDEVAGRITQAGYRVWGEYGLKGRRYFTKDAGEYRTHNIHAYQVGDPAVERHLAFCAYLRSHEAARAEYEVIKRAAYAMHPADVDAYNGAKDQWIKRTQALAIDWYRQQSA